MLKPNEGNKYVFKIINFKSAYLPSYDEVAYLLHLPNNFRGIIDYAQSFYEAKLPVSKSSISTLSTKGIGKPTFKKIENWFLSLSPSIVHIFNPKLLKKNYKAVVVGSNASHFYSCVDSYKFSLRANKNDNELNVLMDWLEERSNADYLLMSEIHRKAKSEIIDKNDPKDIWLLQKTHWHAQSLVPSRQLEVLDEFFKSDKRRENYTFDEVLAIAGASYYLTFDFYLSAIANYEIGLQFYYERLDETCKDKQYSSFFTGVLNTLIESDEVNSCFDAALIELKKFISSKIKPISWRQLASYIPIENSQLNAPESYEPLKDRQYKQLKDWRNGKNLPSFLKLERFVSAICEKLCDLDSSALLVYFRISRGIDTKIQVCFEQTESEKLIPIFNEIIGQYPAYFKYYSERENSAI